MTFQEVIKRMEKIGEKHLGFERFQENHHIDDGQFYTKTGHDEIYLEEYRLKDKTYYFKRKERFYDISSDEEVGKGEISYILVNSKGEVPKFSEWNRLIEELGIDI